MQCLDVLLRWFTLKFYDKNTTVHIKSLEYIKSLFDKLIENDYRMTDYEVQAFVPHLITKVEHIAVIHCAHIVLINPCIVVCFN